MEQEQYNFVLGALARIDKKVDMMSESIQEVKIDLIHMREDIDEARADISELRHHSPVPIMGGIDFDEFEEQFDI